MRKILPAFLVMVLSGSRMQAQEEQRSPQSSPCWTALSQEAENLGKQTQPKVLSQALLLFQQALTCDPASLPMARKGEILQGIGRVQLLLGDNEQGLSTSSSAIEVLQQIAKPNWHLRQEAAFAMHNRGRALRSLQRLDEALAALEESRKLFQALGDSSGQSRALSDIGLVVSLMGDHRASLDYYRQALKLSQRDPRQRAAVLDLIGRAYAQINDFDLAQSYFKNALALSRQTQYHRTTAYTLNDLGSLMVQWKKPKTALKLYAEALAELEKYEPDDGDGIAETQSYLADAQRASGNYDRAIRNYGQAVSFQARAGDVLGEAFTRLSLGRAAIGLQDRALALESLIRATALYHQVHERIGEATARVEMGRIYGEQGEDARAREQVEAAIVLAEEVRALTPGSRLRTAYFASLEEMYRLEMDLLLKQDPVPEAEQRIAFDTLQHAQSRALIDALAGKTDGEDFSCRPDLASSRDELLAKLKQQNQRMQYLRSRSKKAAVEELFVDIKRAETSLEEVEAQCRDEQPRREMLSAGAISLSEVQQQILDGQSALLQFYLSDPHSYVWIVTPSAVRMERLPSKQWLERRVRRVLAFGEAGAWTSVQEAGLAALSEKLLPVLALPEIRRWIVVPDGALHSFPFSLLTGKAAKEIEIVKIPSASAIRAIRRSRDAATLPPVELALFADPVFDPQDSRVRGSKAPLSGSPQAPAALRRGATTRGSYARLLYSEQEARLISSLVPPDQRVLRRDFDARLDAVTGDTLNRFRMVHFATHSVVDESHPDLSGVVFSLVARNGRRIPGYLFLKDIYRMKLRSDLVVLSSCVSAAGSQQTGEGPMSLARGFLYAGSKAVIASLWEVDDEITAQLMGAFYRHMLKDKLSPSEALARTQAEFRHHPNRKLRNPYYWAGFEPYGDWLAH